MTFNAILLPRVEKAGGGHPLPPAAGRSHYSPSAYSLFLLGKDTIEIASALGITEAQDLKSLSVERSRSKGIPMPYEARR